MNHAFIHTYIHIETYMHANMYEYRAYMYICIHSVHAYIYIKTDIHTAF